MQTRTQDSGGKDSSVQRYRLRAPEVIEESIDNEALIVNLLTGSYYSCDGSGELVWRMTLAGMTLDEIAEALAQRYNAVIDVIRDTVAGFLAQLQEEGLIVPDDDGPAAPAPVTAPGASDVTAGAGPQRFTPPELQKFSELQDLLLLDPIHDVAGSGWPTRRQEPA